MTCDDFAELIDLYAADECAPAESRAARDHLARCTTCRESLAQARELQGLLGLHFGQGESLARLTQRLKAEARNQSPAVRLLPFARRFAAVAALLLVTFGLGTMLAPTERSAAPHLSMRLASSRDRLPPDVPGPARGHLELKHALELDGPKRAALEEAIKKAKVTGDWPLPPRVDVELRLNNPGAAPVEVDVGGPNFRCILDLRGPGVIAQPIDDPAFVPFPARTVTLAPGGTLTLNVERLASQDGRRVRYLYPSGPGDYTLRVRLEAAARSQGKQRTIRQTSEPRTLRLR